MNPARAGSKAGAALRVSGRAPGKRSSCACACAPPSDWRSRSDAPFDAIFAQAAGGGRRVLSAHHAVRHSGRHAQRPAPGVRGHAVEQAVLPVPGRAAGSTGDPAEPAPPASRLRGRNHTWWHMSAADVLSMPDKWEYPWFAAWDMAFHAIPFAMIDPDFAKEQLHPAHARVVHASERPDPGLRMGVLATSTRRCTRGRRCGSTRSRRRSTAAATASSWSACSRSSSSTSPGG